MNKELLTRLAASFNTESEEALAKVKANPGHAMVDAWITIGYTMASIASALARTVIGENGGEEA